MTFPVDTTDILIQGWPLIVWYFPCHGLHFATTLRVLKSVLCFHMTSFNYGAKGLRATSLLVDVIKAILCLIASSALTLLSV